MKRYLIELQRYNFKADWTIGRFIVDNGKNGFCVEDEIREVKVHGETAIGFGEFKLSYRDSPKFSKHFLYSETKKILIEAKDKSKYPDIKDFKPHKLIWLEDVQTHKFVLIHWGNSDDDSDGCLIIGKGLGIDAKGQEIVTSSRVYYKSIYPYLFEEIKKGSCYIKILKAE